MTEEQIEFVNNRCYKISIDGKSDYSFNYSGGIISIKDYKALEKLLKIMKDKNIIKSMDLGNESFSVDLIKEFSALEEIKSKGNLDLSTLYKIYENFPNIKEVEFETIDEKILEVYSKFNFTIVTKDKRYEIDDSNRYLLNKTKFSAVKIDSVFPFFPIDEEEIKEFAIYCKEINVFNIDSSNIEESLKVLSLLEANEIKVNHIEVEIKEKEYDELKDLSKLKDHNPSILIKYNGFIFDSLEDFMIVESTIDYCVDLINSQGLSPVEQVMYAYDLVKALVNKEALDNSALEKFLKENDYNNYPNILKAIIEKLGITIDIAEVLSSQESKEKIEETPKHYPNETNDVKNIIKLDDEKYNIHGYFVMDVKGEVKKEEQNQINSYNYFLVPANSYEAVFPNDTYPTFLSKMLNQEIEPQNVNDETLKRCLKEIKENMDLFMRGSKDIKEYYGYINSLGLTPDQFKLILYKVRKAEGYSEEAIQEEISRLSETNAYENIAVQTR